MLDYVRVIKFHIITMLFLSLRRRSQVYQYRPSALKDVPYAASNSLMINGAL